ncbi:MAG TPA: protein-disulfide reductase DsbD domain-containing protein, partial [Hymenobacter sp.]
MKTFSIGKILLLWVGVALLATAQVLTPTHLSTALSQPTAKVGEEVELVVNARIDDKWHLYASDFSDEVGPVVFTMTFKPSPAYALVGKLQSIKSHHEQDEVFKGEVAFWEKTGQLRQRIKVLQPGPLTIAATADYQSCTTVDGRCVPGSDALTFGPLMVTGAAAPTKATGAGAAPASPSKPATAAVTPPAQDASVAVAPAPQPAGAAPANEAPVPAAVAPAARPEAAVAPAATVSAASTNTAGGAGLGLWQY